MASELKTQLINYMTLQRFSGHTKRIYLTGVKLLTKHYMQPPDTLTNEQIQDYIRHLLEERKLSWGTCNSYLSGIVCFYRHICKWDDTQFQIPPRPRVKKLPIVFSQLEVKRLLAAADNLKHRLLLQTVYSAGLRVSELVRLHQRFAYLVADAHRPFPSALLDSRRGSFVYKRQVDTGQRQLSI